ncbi:MAG: diguanylate cyclase [Paucibacter sp.]|nr:diguanylate cyclase [Roseateles sp.]
MNGNLHALSRSLKSRLGSLKLRLALASVSVIFLCVGVTALLVVRDVGARAERSIIDSTLGVDTVSKTIDSRLLNRELALSRAAAQWAPSGEDMRADAAAFLRRQAVLGALFSQLLIVDAQGELLAEADGPHVSTDRHSLRDQQFYRRALAAGGRAITAERGAGGWSDTEIVVAVPMPGAARNAAPALLCGVVHSRKDSMLTDSTDHHAGPDDPIGTVITDASGRIISHGDPQWLERDAGDDPRLHDAVARWRREGAPMEPAAWTWRVGSQFVAMAAVPSAEWMVFRTASADLLLGGPGTARKETFWLSGAVALIGAGLILALCHWLLRPMAQLERRALLLLDDGIPPDSQWPQAAGEIGHLSEVFQHVLALRAASQQRSNEVLTLMRAIVRHAPVGICFVRDGRFELVSQRLSEALGYQGSEELVGQPFARMLPSEAQQQTLTDAAQYAFTRDQSYRGEHEFRHRAGHTFWAWLQGAALTPGDPQAGTIWIVSDISELRAQRERLSWSASHDGLTQLVNRQEFDRRLEQACAPKRRGESNCLLMIDLDGFKLVNDSAGHAAGDAMLQDVAHLLTQNVRDSDTVARLGGDEFAVLLRGCELQQALRLAEQIRDSIDLHRRDWHGLQLRVGTSIGAIHLSPKFRNAAAAMAAADAACYTAKRLGKNRVSVGISDATGAPIS